MEISPFAQWFLGFTTTYSYSYVPPFPATGQKKAPQQIFLLMGAFALIYRSVVITKAFLLKKPRLKTQHRV